MHTRRTRLSCALALRSLLAGIRWSVVSDLGATEVANELLCALANSLRQAQLLAFGVPLGCKAEEPEPLAKGAGADQRFLPARREISSAICASSET